MSPNDAEGMANSVDPDQTAPVGAVWSGSALFAQTCLSENLGTLRYVGCVNNEGPNKAAEMCMLVWAFVVCLCNKQTFHMGQIKYINVFTATGFLLGRLKNIPF